MVRGSNRSEYSEGYKMSMSEFKGATIQALKDIRDDINRLHDGQNDLQSQLNNQKLIATVLGALAGTIGAFLNPFRR